MRGWVPPGLFLPLWGPLEHSPADILAQGRPEPRLPCADKLSFCSPRFRAPGVGAGCPVQPPLPLNAFLPPEPVCRACGWSAALSFSCSEPAIGRQHKLWHLLSVKIQLIPEGRLNISEF